MTSEYEDSLMPAPRRQVAAGEMAAILEEILGPQAAQEAFPTRPPAQGTPAVSDVDKLLRDGTDQQRNDFLGSYRTGVFPADPVNGAVDFATRNGVQDFETEKRLGELTQEVPKVETKGGMLAGMWGFVTDIVGKPLGKALEILDLPAQALETYVGMSYFNEITMAERSKVAHLAYDSIWADVFQGGNTHHEIEQAAMMGATQEDLDKEFTSGWGNGLGHFFMDPMWLVGGVPLVEGALKATRFAGVGRTVGRGINFAEILPEIRTEIPLVTGAYNAVRNIGNPIEDRMLEASLRSLNDLRSTDDIAKIRRTGQARTLLGKSIDARVDDDKGFITNFIAGSRNPEYWEDTGAGQIKIKQLLDDMGDDLPVVHPAANSTDFKQTQIILKSQAVRNALGSMESLKPMAPLNAFWADAKHMLKTERDGKATDILTLMQNKETLTRLERAQLASYRSAKFLLEFEDTGVRSLYDMHRVLPENATMLHTALQGIDRVTSGMKFWLSATVLNSPAFVAMNYVNNIAMIALKSNDLGAAARFAWSPWKFSQTELARLRSAGNTEGMVRALAADSSFQMEFRPDIFGNDPDKWKRLGRRTQQAATFMVGIASRFDEGARNRTFMSGFNRAAASVWKVGDGGVLEDVPQILRDLPGYASWRDGLHARGYDAIDAVQGLHSDELLSAPGLAREWARSVSKSEEEASLLLHDDTFMETLDGIISGVREGRRTARGNEALADIPAGLDDLQDSMDLRTFEDAIRNGAEPKPITTNIVRDKIAPWQDQAFFIENQTHYREMASRTIAAALGNTPRGRAIQGNVIGRMEAYERAVRKLMDEVGNGSLDVGELRRFQARWLTLLDERNDAIMRQFAKAGVPTPRANQISMRTLEVEAEARRLGLQQGELYMGAAENGADALSMFHALQRPGAADALAPNSIDDAADPIRDMAAQSSELYRRMRSLDNAARRLRATRGSTRAPDQLIDILEPERRILSNTFSARNVAVASGEPGALRAAVDADFATLRGARDTAWRNTGFDFTRNYAVPEAPSAAAAAALKAEQAHNLIGWLRNKLPSEFINSKALDADVVQAMKADAEHLRTAMGQRDIVANINGRAMRDFAMLNYTQKNGIDSIIQTVFPYHFWISRTARDWARMAQSRPGSVTGMAHLFTAVQEINEHAGLPDRLKHGIRIPMPFLDDNLVGHLFGGSGTVYFDPLRLLYPMANFQDSPEDQDAAKQSTALGRAHDWASNLPLGQVNPLATLALGSLGALGDRDAYVRRGLASARSLPFAIPGPRGMRALHDWVSGVSEDPDPDVLTPELKQRIAAGEALPQQTLQSWTEAIWDKASTDGFDGYRRDRMIANLVGEDPERWSPRAGMEALKYKRGPLFEEATRRSKLEQANVVLTGWLMMPFRTYPEGEQVQRGLDSVFREVTAQGDPAATEEFFKQHPEYQVRKAFNADRGDDPKAQQREVDSNLFFIDLAEVQSRYEGDIEKLRATHRQAEEAGYLQTKEGRRLLSLIRNDISQLTDAQEGEIDKLEALYPNRVQELSLRASPHERALFELRNAYFDIKRKDYKTSEDFQAARSSFIDKLRAETVPDTTWIGMAVQSAAAWMRASEARAREPQNDGITAKRDEQLRALTRSASSLVSADEFEAYLGSGGKPKTPAAIEYDTVKMQIAEYSAIGESGVSATTATLLKRQYWAAHPLLTKYYGNDEPKPWNAQSAAAYGGMNKIWDGYYAREGDARSQRDYLALNLEQLNTARRYVGLQPLRLMNWQQIPAARAKTVGEVAAQAGGVGGVNAGR